MEEARSYNRGGVGWRKGVGQPIQLAHQSFCPPQPPPLGAAETVGRE